MTWYSSFQEKNSAVKSDALWFRFAGLPTQQRRELSSIIETGAKETVEQIKDNIRSVGIRKHSGSLLEAVKYTMVSMLHARIFIDANIAPYATYLEKGVKPFDLKRGLLASSKAKRSKEGYKYIRIPIDDNIVTLSTKDMYTKKGTRRKSYTASWKYPGYSGKLFFKKGIEEIEPHIVNRVDDYAEIHSLISMGD